MRMSGVVMVTAPGRADPRDLRTLSEHLDRLNCDLLGLIENRAA
jgi:Mrp family chromosome partitioning ATPase